MDSSDLSNANHLRFLPKFAPIEDRKITLKKFGYTEERNENGKVVYSYFVKWTEEPEQISPVSIKMAVKSCSKTSASTCTTSSGSDMKYVHMYLAVKVYIQFVDLNGKERFEILKAELSSDMPVINCLKHLVQLAKNKPINGEFYGFLFTGSPKNKNNKPMLLKSKVYANKPIGKLNDPSKMRLEFQFDCREKMEDSRAEVEEKWLIKV